MMRSRVKHAEPLREEQNSNLLQKCPCELFPFFIDRQGRRCVTASAIPIFGVRLITFLAMEIGMHTHARAILVLLRAFVRLVLIALSIPPQRLQRIA